MKTLLRHPLCQLAAALAVVAAAGTAYRADTVSRNPKDSGRFLTGSDTGSPTFS